MGENEKNQNKMRYEKIIMNISLIGSILFMLSEGFMAYYTKSHSLLMDCIFDVTDLIMIGPFMVLVPLLYKPVTEKRPYGFSQVESLFVVIKYSVLLVITIQLVWDNLYTIFHGGRHVDGGSIAVFELAVCAGCLIIYILMYYFSRKYCFSNDSGGDLHMETGCYLKLWCGGCFFYTDTC